MALSLHRHLLSRSQEPLRTSEPHNLRTSEPLGITQAHQRMHTFQNRSSPLVESLRLKTPYVAFAARVPPPAPNGPTPTTIAEQDTRPSAWVENRGYGSRHTSDVAPFTLWDSSNRDFRYPSVAEQQWIIDTFHATRVTWSWPEIIITTPVAPRPVPLTVACVAAIFTPSDDYRSCLSTDTDYSNPSIPDPVPKDLHLHKWERPSKEQCEKVFDELQKLANIQAINFIPPSIIVELRVDDCRTYEKRSLPGRVGGQTTLYHHSDELFWDVASQGRERLIDPGDTIQDATNYIAEQHTLYPGVKVESSRVGIDSGLLMIATASTAGALVRSSADGQRLTVSNHCFQNSAEVYHPSSKIGGICIGQITERFEALDIALVKLFPKKTLTNSQYFQAQPPKRLLLSNEVPNNTWCSLDSMASGLVFLRVGGVRYRPDLSAENILRCVGPVGGEVRDGMCGAPIVVDDNEDGGGGVVGFFQSSEGNSDWAICPCLDDLVNRGWTLA